jgi:hypothetical protein
MVTVGEEAAADLMSESRVLRHSGPTAGLLEVQLYHF